MFTNQSVHDSSSSLRAVISAATQGLVEREALVEMVALSAVAEEHVLVIGPPGTAKSEAVRRIARATGGQYFKAALLKPPKTCLLLRSKTRGVSITSAMKT